MADNKDEQQKLMQFQLLQQQIEQYSQQLELMNQQLMELENSKEALDGIKKTPKDTEIMANVAPGVFVKAALKENQKMIVNVGADITVEKTVPQVIEMLEEQKKSMQENIVQLDAALQKYGQEALKIYEEFRAKETKKEK